MTTLLYDMNKIMKRIESSLSDDVDNFVVYLTDKEVPNIGSSVVITGYNRRVINPQTNSNLYFDDDRIVLVDCTQFPERDFSRGIRPDESINHAQYKGKDIIKVGANVYGAYLYSGSEHLVVTHPLPQPVIVKDVKVIPKVIYVPLIEMYKERLEDYSTNVQRITQNTESEISGLIKDLEEKLMDLRSNKERKLHNLPRPPSLVELIMKECFSPPR